MGYCYCFDVQYCNSGYRLKRVRLDKVCNNPQSVLRRPVIFYAVSRSFCTATARTASTRFLKGHEAARSLHFLHCLSRTFHSFAIIIATALR
jgi:hypothetical protein